MVPRGGECPPPPAPPMTCNPADCITYYAQSMLALNSTKQKNAAPTAPRNVTVVDVTRGSITIIWLPPDPTNGMIESYDIEVTPVDDNSDMIRLITVTPMDELMYNISGLMEYVNYSIIVFARTDKGRGPGSEAIIVQTLEHREWLRTLSLSFSLSLSLSAS